MVCRFQLFIKNISIVFVDQLMYIPPVRGKVHIPEMRLWHFPHHGKLAKNILSTGVKECMLYARVHLIQCVLGFNA